MKTLIALFCFLNLVILPTVVISVPISSATTLSSSTIKSSGSTTMTSSSTTMTSSSTRKPNYDSLFSLVDKLASSVKSEHAEFLKLSGLEDKTSKDKQLEIDNKKLSITNLKKNLEGANSKFTALYKEKDLKLSEKTKIENSLKIQQKIIDRELANVQKFYNESTKFKTYQEYPSINKEIDDLKTSIAKESNDIQEKYRQLLKKTQTDLSGNDIKISAANEDVKNINKDLEDANKNYDQIQKTFEEFLVKYNKNVKDRKNINKNFKEELEMLDNVLKLLKNTDPSQMKKALKCSKLQEKYDDLLKSLKPASALLVTPTPVVPKAEPVVPKAEQVVPKAEPVVPKAEPVAPAQTPVAPKVVVAPVQTPVAPKVEPVPVATKVVTPAPAQTPVAPKAVVAPVQTPVAPKVEPVPVATKVVVTPAPAPVAPKVVVTPAPVAPKAEPVVPKVVVTPAQTPVAPKAEPVAPVQTPVPSKVVVTPAVASKSSPKSESVAPAVVAPITPSTADILKARNDRSKTSTLSASAKQLVAKRDEAFIKWMLSKDGVDASNFCMSLGIHNKPSIFAGCLEDMMSTGNKKIAKDSAIMEEEIASKDKQSTTASTSKRYCVAAGDPHFVNYDGEVYHLQEPGVYTLAKANGFEVQQKTKKNGKNIPGVPSCMIGAAIKSGEVTIEVDVNNLQSVLINGKSQELPQDYTVKIGGVSLRYGNQVIEWRKNSAKVTALKITGVNGFSALVAGGYCGIIEVNAPESFYGKMQGLCGNADGVRDTSDYKDPSGVVLDVKRGTKNWEMSGYGGPTSPLSKWQLSWKSTGSNCFFAKECEVKSVVETTPKALLSSPELTKNNLIDYPIKITCDNNFRLYVNGNLVGSGDNWQKVYSFTPKVNLGVDTIALEGHDVGGPAAFIGVFNNINSKPSDWVCKEFPTQRPPPNWNMNNFDDSNWKSPLSYGKNSDKNTVWFGVNRGSLTDLSNDAQWLWTNNYNNHDHVYCRMNQAPLKDRLVPSLSITLVPKAVPSQVSVTVPLQVQAPKQSPTPAPKSSPTQAPAPKPAHTPAPKPAPAPAPKQAPAPAPKQAPAPAPKPAPAPAPKKAPAPAPKPAPAPAPKKAPAPAPKKAPTPAPAPAPKKAPAPAPKKAPTPAPKPAPAPASRKK